MFLTSDIRHPTSGAKRHPDWVARLSAAIAAQNDAPFEWGVRDCCLAAADLVMAVRDLDVAAPFRARGSRYKTARGAAGVQKRYLGEAGAGDMPLLDAVCTKRAAALGLVEVPVLRAQRGDLVLLPLEPETGETLEVLSVVNLTGMNLLFAPLEGGWAATPLEGGKRAWRI